MGTYGYELSTSGNVLSPLLADSGLFGQRRPFSGTVAARLANEARVQSSPATFGAASPVPGYRPWRIANEARVASGAAFVHEIFPRRIAVPLHNALRR